jgi:hypothetical protein
MKTENEKDRTCDVGGVTPSLQGEDSMHFLSPMTSVAKNVFDILVPNSVSSFG